MRTSLLLALLTLLVFAPPASAARWSVAECDVITLDSNGFSPAELSGVAYLGSTGNTHQFVAVQDNGNGAVQFDLTLDSTGAVQTATTTAAFPFAENLDSEGIALTASPGIVLVSEEDDPSVRRIRLSDGAELSRIAAPPVYANHRDNRGFESLATWSVAAGGLRMATANEEALTVDGPVSGIGVGTVVRVQTYDLVGDSSATLTPTATKQFAYEVDPIHAGTSTANKARSGLSELTALPDRTLFALERSLAGSLSPPPFQDRLYEIDARHATDTSDAAFDAGLAGAAYAPAAKELLWSGAAGGGLGQNMEGLTVGPQLANGNWLLVGVVDDGDPLSSNTIVTFEAAPVVSSDFDDSGETDGGDFLQWQRDAGQNLFLADAFDADGNRDGAVDAADLALWQSGFAAVAGGTPVPEPATLVLACMALIAFGVGRNE